MTINRFYVLKVGIKMGDATFAKKIFVCEGKRKIKSSNDMYLISLY